MSSSSSRRPSRASLTIAALAALLLTSLLSPSAWALRLPGAAATSRVQVYTLWNPTYLCLAAKAPDPMLTGSSVGPMSAPEQDDAIEFDLEVRTSKGLEAHRLIISAAGGMTVLTRDPQGRWRPDQSWISGTQMLKYAVTPDGTLNNPTDRDVGYSVECAIPWQFLGGEAPVERSLGFNVVCWNQGDSETPVSWMQTVTSEADIGDTSRWGKLAINPNSELASATGGVMPCPFGRIPFIDGRLSAGEWMTASTLTFVKPEVTLPPVLTPEKQADVVGTLLAIYRYDWQGDSSRPGAHLWQPDGGPATSDQPKEAAGPWYSWERVAWHRAQLDEVQRAGIDIVLASYRGDDASRRTWARLGLDRLSEALKGMRAEGHSYPLVGMALDTAPLAGVDLKSEEGKRLCYGMVRDFFLHVPREFWAELPARPDLKAAGGVPVLLGEPTGLADWDGAFLSYAQESFARDFGGAKLAWIGSNQWRTKGVDSFYSYVRLPVATGVTQEGAGGVSAMAISPGFSPAPGAAGEIRSRREGRAYRSDWQRVLATAPELVVLDSWNDFADGTDLAPSRQYGFAYVDMTRYFAARMNSKQPHSLRLKKQAAPRVMLPGTDYRVELVIKNVGTEDFQTDRRISVDYRITRVADGKVVQARPGAQEVSIMAGQTLRLPVVITTKDDRGEPLSPGSYTFSFQAVRSSVAYMRSRWFAKPEAEISIPITVGKPPARLATVISTSLPSAIESGAAEQVVVRLRNDGAATWRASETSFCYRWLRHQDGLGDSGSDEVVDEGERASLPGDVPPGEIASVMIPIAAKLADGGALPAPGAEDLWHYRVQWDLADKEGAFGGDLVSEAIEVIPLDRGALLASAATPAKLEAGQGAKIEVTVANAGPHAWKAGESRVTYHWYRWDGRGLGGETAGTPLPADLPSGEKMKLEASLLTPEAPGPYWLVWDLVANGQSFANVGGGRRADMLVQPVIVTGGKLRTIDLSALTNVIAVADDSHRARGDFDGQGRSFPAEWFAPDQTGAEGRVYPSGYYSPSPSWWAPFLFPEASSGVGGAVACDGQSIPLGGSGARRVHLLLASSFGQEDVSLGLKLADGKVETVTMKVSPWRSTSGQLEDVGAFSPYLRSPRGDEATPAYLYYKAIAPSSGSAVSLELPKQPSVKIVAVTVEE